MPTSGRSLKKERRHAPGRQRGSGMISALAGVVAFLGFVFFAVQLMFNLYATSVVTANGFDAARQVAAATSPAEAEAQARSRMGRYGQRVKFNWNGTNTDVVRLEVTAANPRLLLFSSSVLPFTNIKRHIEVRVERPR